MKRFEDRARIGLVCLAIFFIAWGLRATVFYPIDEAIPAGVPRSLFSTTVKFSLWVLPAFAFVALLLRQSPWRYLGFVGHVSRREWVIAGLITGAYMGSVVILELSLGAKAFQPHWPGLLGMLFLLGSCLIEETLFRGLILHYFSEYFRGYQANLITSLLFVAVHWPYWLWSRGLTLGVLSDSIGVFLVSLFFGVLFLRTRSIWPPFLAHSINNLVAALLVAPLH